MGILTQRRTCTICIETKGGPQGMRDTKEVNRIGMMSKMKHINRKIRSKYGESLRLGRSQSLMPMMLISTQSF